MIAEAIDRVLKLANIREISRDGVTYVSEIDKLQRLKPPGHVLPEPLKMSTLDGLISYLVTNPDELEQSRLRLHVVDMRRVDLIGPIDPANDNRRFCYAVARAPDARFNFNSYTNLEEFIIAIQTGFVRTPEAAAVVGMLANVANEAIRQNADDGYSHTISIKSGLTTKSEVKVKNPVELQPIMTFSEAAQPVGQFLLRLKDQGAGAPPLVSLFIADPAALMFAGANAVADYLAGRIVEELLEVKVII